MFRGKFLARNFPPSDYTKLLNCSVRPHFCVVESYVRGMISVVSKQPNLPVGEHAIVRTCNFLFIHIDTQRTTLRYNCNRIRLIQASRNSHVIHFKKMEPFPHNTIPNPLITISIAIIAITGKKMSRNVLLLSLISRWDPINAPSRTPRATGAAINGGISPREK